MAYTHIIGISYVLYVTNSALYHFLIAVARSAKLFGLLIFFLELFSSVIAGELQSANYSLVFGCNTFCALLFQSLLTLVVTDKRTLALPIRTQASFGYLLFLLLATL